ncbi:hypothetical protein CR513_31377, partial [Mucuna pruriens]
MTWILSFVDPTIVLNFRPYLTVATMWVYLKRSPISDFYSQFMNLWTEYTDIIYASMISKGLSLIQIVRKTTKQDQFLMNIQSNLRDYVPSLDEYLSIYYMKNNVFLHNFSLKNKNHSLFL